MYFGMALLSFGIALVFTSLAGAILSVVAAMIIDRAVIRREEAYLTRRFGEDYLAYTRRVRRWF
jgi:protein-S-isoprenylcysteine O-methyltransferase Ste14